MTDNTRRHHYVSAFYLKQFATPQDRHGRLFVYDRIANRRFPETPDGSAHERDFNSVEVEGEHPNLIEKMYSDLESKFAPTIARVCERGTLPKDDPVAMGELLFFVATQATRTRRVRELFKKFYNDTGMLVMHTLGEDRAAYIRSLREEDPELTAADADAVFSDHIAFLNAKGARVEMDQTTLVKDAVDLSRDVVRQLEWRWWILLVAPTGTGFITTDDPVHLQPSTRDHPKHPLWSPGFGDMHTNVIVPLSPRLALMGLPYEFTARARVRYDRREVAELNTSLALSAHRFVYSNEPVFAQIGQDNAVVEGPTEMLRRKQTESAAARFGFFEAGT